MFIFKSFSSRILGCIVLIVYRVISNQSQVIHILKKWTLLTLQVAEKEKISCNFLAFTTINVIYISNCLSRNTAFKYNKKCLKNLHKQLNFEKNNFREFPILKITKCTFWENEAIKIKNFFAIIFFLFFRTKHIYFENFFSANFWKSWKLHFLYRYAKIAKFTRGLSPLFINRF